MKRKKARFGERPIFASPGSLKYVGKEINAPSVITRIDYDAQSLNKSVLKSIDDLQIKQGVNTWIEVEGLHDVQKVNDLGVKFGLHPLSIEDILNSAQKAKIDLYDKENQLFLTLKHVVLNPIDSSLETEHLALVLCKDCLISFQELGQNNVFQELLNRLQRDNSKTKRMGLDYLFYVLIDLIVDNYFLILESLDSKMEILSDKIMLHANTGLLNDLFYHKKEVLHLKRIVLPMREIMLELIRDDGGFFKDENKVYLKDVYEHIREILDNIDSLKDETDALAGNLHNQMAAKMNTVMKTLTIFTAIFMPLSFIAGIYGMNFKYMPEIENPLGYYYTLAFMLIVGLALWLYFKFKKYI